MLLLSLCLCIYVACTHFASKCDRTRTLPAANENAVVVENLRDRLAETEARLERARAREAELSRQLEEMKRYVCVMEILECYLKRRYREQQVRTLAVVNSK